MNKKSNIIYYILIIYHLKKLNLIIEIQSIYKSLNKKKIIKNYIKNLIYKLFIAIKKI